MGREGTEREEREKEKRERGRVRGGGGGEEKPTDRLTDKPQQTDGERKIPRR